MMILGNRPDSLLICIKLRLRLRHIERGPSNRGVESFAVLAARQRREHEERPR